MGIEAVRRALETLPREYRIYQDCRWIRRSSEGGRIGEADFVVAHEYRGVAVIAVAREAQGLEEAEARALQARFALEAKMREHRRSTRLWSAGFAVAVPAAEVVPPARLDPAVVLDRTALRDPRRAVDRLLDYWSGTVPGPVGMQILEDILARPRTAAAEATLVRLTEEQVRLLDFLSGHTRAAIRGGAGTGKTILAVEKARRLAAEGFRVLFVCYNKLLGRAAARMLEGAAGVDVLHFHELCVQRARAAGLEIIGPQDDPSVDEDEFFSETLPRLLIEAARRVPDRYDAVVVDEGQDFRGGWWRALEAVMAPGAVLYVFYDENQAIFGPPEGMPIATPPFTLTRNCRQTAALNEWVARLCDGEVHPKDDAPPGVPPEIRRYRSEDELHRHVEEVLEHWIGREHLAPGDVAVLTPHGRACRVWRRRAYGPWRLTEEWPAPGGQVAWATVHRFKGLEASGVILAEIEPDVPGGLARVLYVGASRARHRLAIVASAEVDLERARGVSAVGAQAPPAPLR